MGKARLQKLRADGRLVESRTRDGSCPVTTDQILPARLESEKAALGAVLVDSKYLSELLAFVCIEDFALSSHREILRAAVNLGTGADLVTVVEELQRIGKLETVGGPAYVGSLIDGVPDQPNLGAYARNIRDAARAR